MLWRVDAVPRETVALDAVRRMAFQFGYAHGERTGYACAVSEIERVVYNRRGFEVMQEDIDAVRKGAIH